MASWPKSERESEKQERTRKQTMDNFWCLLEKVDNYIVQLISTFEIIKFIFFGRGQNHVIKEILKKTRYALLWSSAPWVDINWNQRMGNWAILSKWMFVYLLYSTHFSDFAVATMLHNAQSITRSWAKMWIKLVVYFYPPAKYFCSSFYAQLLAHSQSAMFDDLFRGCFKSLCR